MRQRRSAFRRLQAYLAPYHQISPESFNKDIDHKDSPRSSTHDIKQGESLITLSDPPPPYERSSLSSESTVALPPILEETEKADGGELWSGSSKRRPISSSQLVNQLPVLHYQGRVRFTRRHRDDDDPQ